MFCPPRRVKKGISSCAVMIEKSNFALEIETCWAKKVVKSILETWNANDGIVYV